MSDLKLFRIGAENANDDVCEIQGSSLALEKSLQTLIEQNLETFLGIRFLASEFSTGREHGGRMDTLGIDENMCPVIIEYKRSSNMNVINQGLFYLDWLVTHRGDFEMLVLKQFGEDAAKTVEWSAPRLICIAGDFSKYDEHAIKQMNHNIELIRYVKFDDDLLLLEQVNAVSAPASHDTRRDGTAQSDEVIKPVEAALEKCSPEMQDLYAALDEFLRNLGDDVQVKTLKHYLAYKRIKNFTCVNIKPQKECFVLHIKVNPDTVELEEGFTRDVRNLGHFGTGELEVILSSMDDLEKAKPLFEKSYQNA